MSESQIPGGAGPALAAHSKDASTPGQTAASAATGGERPSDTVNELPGQARDTAQRISASMSHAAETVSATVSQYGGRAGDQAAAYVREQPYIALAATGALCFVLGLLVGRR